MNVKLKLDVNIIGNRYATISPLKIHYDVYDYQNPILYISSDGFVFEKKYYNIIYNKNRLIIPPFILAEKNIIEANLVFDNNEQRYNNLKRLYFNIMEFCNSGFFGKNEIKFKTNNSEWIFYSVEN